MRAVRLRAGGRWARPRAPSLLWSPESAETQTAETQLCGEPVGARVDVERRSRARTRTAACPAPRRAAPPGSVGAPTATTPASPARLAFCTSSKLARPAEAGDHARQRLAARQQQRADRLVHRVVAADVLAQREQLARRPRTARWRAGRRCARSRAARAGRPPGSREHQLAARPAGPARPAAPRGCTCSSAALPHTPQDEVRWKRRSSLGSRRRPLRGAHVDHVAPRGPSVGPDRGDVAGPAISASPARKPTASSSSSPGRAHRHRERLAVDADLERLLDRHLVAHALARAARAPARSR